MLLLRVLNIECYDYQHFQLKIINSSSKIKKVDLIKSTIKLRNKKY